MKIGMLFPGYSNQFVGMGKDLYDESRVMQEYFEEAYNCLNLNFIKLCFASSDNELSKITNANTSIFLLSAALTELLKENNVKPDIVAGHGIGNFAAMFAANALTFPDSLYLLKKFSSFYEEYLPNMNVNVIKVTGINFSKLKKYCKNFSSIEICAQNNILENLVSGKIDEIENLKELLKSDKIKVQIVGPEIGLNSELMQDVIDQFKVYLEKVDFKDSSISLVSSINSKEICSAKNFRNYLINQIKSPILFDKVLDKLSDCDLIIEVGPGNSLVSFAKEKFPEKTILSFNKKNDLEEIKKFLNVNETIMINADINNISLKECDVT